MVSGAVISNETFSEVLAPARVDELRSSPWRLRALELQTVWLESEDTSLQQRPGSLTLRAEAMGAQGATLRRDAHGHRFELTTCAGTYVALHRGLAGAGRANLRPWFDVEYREGYESPGGYSADHGVRYWDDVLYPVVRADRFEFVF